MRGRHEQLLRCQKLPSNERPLLAQSCRSRTYPLPGGRTDMPHRRVEVA